MTNNSIGKILVVDDEVELRNILVEALILQGYEAVGFTTGEEALAALRGEVFDILLTDLMMPGMDGITLVRESCETVAIHGLCQTIAFTLDQQTILSELADAALQQTAADEVSVLLPTADGEELYVAAKSTTQVASLPASHSYYRQHFP